MIQVSSIKFGNGAAGDLVFTGTIDEGAGTASGTWSRHIPGNCFSAGGGAGTWSARRTFP
jgi:hypothetical protein